MRKQRYFNIIILCLLIFGNFISIVTFFVIVYILNIRREYIFFLLEIFAVDSPKPMNFVKLIFVIEIFHMKFTECIFVVEQIERDLKKINN